MSFKSLLALSLAAVAFAAPATPALTVSVAPVGTTARSSKLVLAATVANPTSEDIKVIKYGTILDNQPTYSFKATKDGQEVPFSGIRIHPDLTNEDAWTVIPAGGNVTVHHKLGSNYDFVGAGIGTFSFEPSVTRFQTSDDQLLEVQVNTVAVNVQTVEAPVEASLTTPTCANTDQRNRLAAMLSEARALAGGAATDIRSHPNSGQFATYFGNNSRDYVWYLFDRIAGDLASSGTRILSCTDDGYCASHPGVAAYTSLAWTGDGTIVRSDIYVCNGWLNWPVTHTGICNNQANVRGTIMVHELSHAIGRTTDIYGCSTVKGISDAQKKDNADNYACFAAQIHKDYNC